MTFPCFDCGGHVGLLILGSCRFCEPELHAGFDAAMRRVESEDRAYFVATGKLPLQDWAAFEAWAESRVDG